MAKFIHVPRFEKSSEYSSGVSVGKSDFPIRWVERTPIRKRINHGMRGKNVKFKCSVLIVKNSTTRIYNI